MRWDKAGGCPTEENVAVFAVVHLYLRGVVQNIYVAVMEVHDDKTLAAFDVEYMMTGVVRYGVCDRPK